MSTNAKTEQESKHQMEVVLGFGKLPGNTYIFVDADESTASCWYMLENDSKVHIEHQALTGFLVDIVVKPTMYKDKWSYKLDLHIMADRRYVVRSGLTTIFSSGALQALIQVTDYSKPITLAAVKGNENVVFANLYDPTTGQRIMYQNNRDLDHPSVVKALQTALGITVQDKESLAADKLKYSERSQRRLEIATSQDSRPSATSSETDNGELDF